MSLENSLRARAKAGVTASSKGQIQSNWSRGREPDEESPQARAPRAERVAEIFEELFNRERDLTADLLAELARCSAADLAKLFGSAPPPAPGHQNGDAAQAAEQPTDGRRYGYSGPELSGAPQAQATDPSSWRWDANGNRITKLPSSFPRQRYEPPKRPGTHWSN
jgi:hypothetical protein